MADQFDQPGVVDLPPSAPATTEDIYLGKADEKSVRDAAGLDPRPLSSAELDRMLQKYGDIPKHARTDSAFIPDVVEGLSDLDIPKMDTKASKTFEQDLAEGIGKQPLFKVIERPSGVARDWIFRILSGKGDYLGGALRSIKGAENVTGNDLGLALMRHVDPVAVAGWQARMAQLGMDEGKFGHTLAGMSDEELHQVTHPYGYIGSMFGFAAEAALDPFTYLLGAGELANAKTGTSTKNLLARDVATDTQAQVRGNLSDAIRAAYGSQSPFMPREGGAVVPATEAAKALQQRGALVNDTMDEVAKMAEKLDAHIQLQRMRPLEAKAARDLRSAKREFGKITFSGNIAGKEEVATNYQRALDDVADLAKKRIDLEKARGAFSGNVDRQLLLGVLGSPPDADLPRTAAAEVYDGILGHVEALKNLPADSAPIERAMTQADYPGVGMSQLEWRMREAVRHSDEMQYYLTPSLTGDSLITVHQKDLDGAMAISKAAQAYREMGLALPVGVYKGQGHFNPALLDEVGRRMEAAGVPKVVADRMGYEVLVDNALNKDLAAFLNDARSIRSARQALTPADLTVMSQEHLAIAQWAAQYRRAISQRVHVGKFGIPLPVEGPSEFKLLSDESGKPLRVFHGTTSSGETFSNGGLSRFFTEDPAYASTYADRGIHYGDEGFSQPVGGNVRPAYLKYRKMLDMTQPIPGEEAAKVFRESAKILRASGKEGLAKAFDDRAKQAIGEKSIRVGMNESHQDLAQKAAKNLGYDLVKIEEVDSPYPSYAVLDPGNIHSSFNGPPDLPPSIKIKRVGKLSREKLREWQAYQKSVDDAYNAFITSDRGHVLDSMESLFGSQAVINPEGKLGRMIANMPGLRKLTWHGYQVPTFPHINYRDPFKVFEGTGIAEGLFDASKTTAEGSHHYQGLLDTMFDGMPLDDRYMVQRVVENKVPKGMESRITPKIRDTANAYKAFQDEIRDILGIDPKVAREDYFTHVVNQYPQLNKSMAEGHLPPDMMRDAKVIDEMLRRSSVGKNFTSRFAKRRVASDAEYELDPLIAGKIYARSAMRAKYMGPAFRDAGELLRGAKFRPGLPPSAPESMREAYPTLTRGIADSPNLAFQKEDMIAYLKMLEDEYHGRPIPFDQRWHERMAKYAHTAGINGTPEELTNTASKMASYVSDWLVTNEYRNTLGGPILVPTPFKNLSQVIIPASEHGPLNALKAFARYFRKRDVAEIGLNGGAATEQGIKRLTDAEIRRARLDWADAFDLHNKSGYSRAMKWYDDHIGFRGIQASENINRGLSTYVGWGVGIKEGADPHTVLRLGQRVSNETQFVYGTFGRGPMFHSVYAKPIIGPFTSFPLKMGGTMKRLMTENPSSLIRFIGTTGMMSNMLTRHGMDPADLLPWGWMPNRLGLFFGQVGLGKFFKGAYHFATEPEGSEKWKQSKVDMVNGLLFGGLLPTPNAMIRNYFQIQGLYSDDELRSRADLVKLIPGLKEYVFHNSPPGVVLRTTDEARKAWITVAKIFGFNDLTEEDARQQVHLMSKDAEAQMKTRYMLENIIQTYGNLKPKLLRKLLTKDELDALNQSGMSDQQIQGIFDSVANSHNTFFRQRVDAAGRREQRNIKKNIQEMIPDPKERKEMYDLHLDNVAKQKMLHAMQEREKELMAQPDVSP